jgi:hypothetical protein
VSSHDEKDRFDRVPLFESMEREMNVALIDFALNGDNKK